jgi:hypothetical protein
MTGVELITAERKRQIRNEELRYYSQKNNFLCDDKFVAVSHDGKIAYSTDGIDWTTKDLVDYWVNTCYSEQ